LKILFSLQKINLILTWCKSIKAKAKFLFSSQNEEGSATLEFVSLAIPLLIPLLLFSTQLSLITSKDVSLHNALRESSHLFINSTNDYFARSKVDLFLSKEFPSASISIICDATPCLTHNSLVHFKISLDGISQSLTFSVGSWQ
jgi:hypothetical protein